MLDRHIVIRVQDVQVQDIGPLGSSDQEVAKHEGHQQSEHRLPAHRKWPVLDGMENAPPSGHLYFQILRLWGVGSLQQ